MTVVGEYQTKLEGVFHLTLSLDNLLWIGDGYHKKKIRFFSSHKGLQKVKCEGDRLQLISSFNNQIYNLAINSGNDLLLATDGPILKQIKNGTHEVVNTVYDLHSYQPISIYVTRNNKVVVGASNSHKQVVIVLDNKGNPEKVYGDDQTKYISFTCPCRITGTSNNNIFVIDSTGDEYEGRVVLLGQKDISHTYSGNSIINTNIPFAPSDITATPSDNVIVVDSDSSTLHVLNPSGQLLTYISLKDKGIPQDPFSIELAMTRHFCMLYIGTVTDKRSKDKAKLYKFSLKGC